MITRARGFWRSVLRHFVLGMGAIVMLTPFLWMLSLSIKSPADIFSSSLSLIPRSFYGIENYTAALGAAPILRFMLNGAIVCAAILFLQLLVATPCAYALAKLRFRGRETIFGFVLIGLLIPPQVLSIPLFVMLYWVGLLDSYAALVVPWVISVFGIFLLRQFFRTVPDDLISAARLDGFSEISIIWRIMVPAALPAYVAFAIFSIVAHWNDLFWPLIVVQNSSIATPALGAMYFTGEQSGGAYGPLMAGVTMITAPLLLVFLFAQRRFIDGITMSGVK